MTNNNERRTGLFYRKLFWSVVGSAVGILIVLFAWAYKDLNERKANKETVAVELQAVREIVREGFESLRREIRAAMRERWP